MLGSLLFLLNKVNEISQRYLSRPMPDVISGANTLLILVGQVAWIFGFVAFYRIYAQRGGRLSRIGLGLFSGGGILLAVAHVTFMDVLVNRYPVMDVLFLFIILGVLLMIAGLVSFGIASLRQPVLSRWQWLPLLTCVVGLIGFFFFSGEKINATFLTLRALFALGLFFLGLALWLEQPREREEASLSLAASDL